MTEANTIDAGNARDEFPYPEGRVVGIIEAVEKLWDTEEALVTAGFLESEIDVACGESAADKLQAGTGRKGIANIAMRFVAKIGLPNDETAMRRRYEDALRDGKFVITVVTPTDDRKILASRVIHDHGGSFIHFFGPRTFEIMAP